MFCFCQAKLNEKLTVAKAEGNRLSGLIVQSPERMKSEAERMQLKLVQVGPP